MKNLFIIMMFGLILAACKDENTDPILYPTGSMTDRSECKLLILVDNFDTNQECFQYTYVNNTLTIKHINTGLNCCPDPINATISVDNGIITIDESKAANGCKCECLFDIGYKIEDLTPGTYRVVFKGPIELNGDLPLDTTIDLLKNKEGDYCVQRTHYPWDRG